MKVLMNFFDRFNQLDTTVNQWLVENSSTLLRICTGMVFLEFGLIKFFYGSGPVEGLATYLLTGGLLSGDIATLCVAILECVTGACFLSSRSIRLGIWLLGVQLLGALVPLLLFSNELIRSLSTTPVLVAQYIITEIVLVATGLFIAVNWNKSRFRSEKAWV